MPEFYAPAARAVCMHDTVALAVLRKVLWHEAGKRPSVLLGSLGLTTLLVGRTRYEIHVAERDRDRVVFDF
jgi:hypothetical protein